MVVSKELLSRIQNWIEDHSEQIVADLQAFARIRSVSRADQAEDHAPFGRECREMLDFALARGREMGFATADHAGYCGSVWMGDIDQAIGIFGHLDVVPEGDGWLYPPYGATRTGDFLIGRGVADNKSACVMGLYLLKMLQDLRLTLRHGVRVVMGASEETGMQDMPYFVRTQKIPVVSLVPDSGFPVNHAQKGSLSARISIPQGDELIRFEGGEADNIVPACARALVAASAAVVDEAFQEAGVGPDDFTVEQTENGTLITARGRAAHAAAPEGGKSAIHMLAQAISDARVVSGISYETVCAIAGMTQDYYGGQAGINCEDPVTGKTTMVLGVAETRGGRVYLNVDCRLSVNADLAEVKRAFSSYCDQTGFALERINVTEPVYMPVDDPRVIALMDVYQTLTGHNDPAYAMGGGTYSRVIPDAITYGPGFPFLCERPDGLPEGHGGAHQSDEYLYIPSLLQAMKVYAAAILTLDALV